MFKKVTSSQFLVVSVLLLIFLNLFFGALWVTHGNIIFHTDIARDFLLIEDIVDNHHFALIGPRSGAIPGVFHGPLWLYLNVPAFILGGGNPVIVGWFWVLLSVIAIIIIYKVGEKLFSKEIGILSALLLSSIQVPSINSLFNPYGALLLSPLFYYFLCKYLETFKVQKLIFSLGLLGLIIQFQMAYGVPLLLLSIPLVLFYVIKQHKLIHLFSYLILLLPLATFILFDLRHQFLQVKSVIAYLTGVQTHGQMNLNLEQLTNLRLTEIFIEGPKILATNFLPAIIIVVMIITYVFYKTLKKKQSFKYNVVLFFYLYFGFWIISFLFKGPMWGYYYWPFLPLVVLIFVSSRNFINKWLFYVLFSTIFIFNMRNAVFEVINYQINPYNQDQATWLFNFNIAKNIFEEAKGDFGYYIFTPDLYGYPPRYAMDFVQKQNLDKKAYPFEKKTITYLLIAPPPEYGKDPSSIWYQKNTNSMIWKSNDVRIDAKPAQVTSYNNGFSVEKYNLTPEDLKINSNPYLIQSIFFR